MYTIKVTEDEYNVLLSALQTKVDICDDTLTEEVWLDANTETVSRDQLNGMRESVHTRANELIWAVRLLERVECLKK